MESPRIIISDSASTSPIRLRSSSFSVSPSSDSLNPSPNTEDLERGLSDDLLCVPNQPQRFHKPRLSIPSLPSWSKSSSPSPAISISSLLSRKGPMNTCLSIRPYVYMFSFIPELHHHDFSDFLRDHFDYMNHF